MIYFAQLPTGSIKIGYTANLDQRMQVLGSSYRARPAILHTMEGDRQTEREMHRRFDHLRIGITEQFRPASDLLEFIGKPLLVSENPEAVESHPTKMQSAKLETDVVESARIVASCRGESLSEMMSGILRPILAKMEREEMSKRLNLAAKPSEKKGGSK